MALPIHLQHPPHMVGQSNLFLPEGGHHVAQFLKATQCDGNFSLEYLVNLKN